MFPGCDFAVVMFAWKVMLDMDWVLLVDSIFKLINEVKVIIVLLTSLRTYNKTGFDCFQSSQ